MPMTGKPREMAQGLPGKQPCPLACCTVPAYAMRTYVSLISECPVGLGWGLPSGVSSLWLCFPCLPQQRPLTTACLDVALYNKKCQVLQHVLVLSFVVIVLIFFLKQGLTVYIWLSWSSLCKPDCPEFTGISLSPPPKC